VRAAIEALAQPRASDDRRTQRQRNADALVELCEAYLDAGELPEVAAQRPHVILISSVDALDEVPGAPASHLDGYGAVCNATARMLACDGEVTEIVVDERGRPLQVKETGRPTRRQRRAVIGRDGVCIGCGAPAARCQLHHVVWRRNKGATVVENLVLCCWSCHRKIHHNGWQVVVRQGRFALRPPGVHRDAVGPDAVVARDRA
jgi:coenzyme F420-reducing hydrogenase gamma subunit